MIDLRSTTAPTGVSLAGLETARGQGTRFYWMLCCEHCLSRTTYQQDGLTYCGGCDRAAMISPHETPNDAK